MVLIFVLARCVALGSLLEEALMFPTPEEEPDYLFATKPSESARAITPPKLAKTKIKTTCSSSYIIKKQCSKLKK